MQENEIFDFMEAGGVSSKAIMIDEEKSGIEMSETNDGIFIRVHDIPQAILWLESKIKDDIIVGDTRPVNQDEIEDVLAATYALLKDKTNHIFAQRFLNVKKYLLESNEKAGILRLFLDMFGEKTATDFEMKMKFNIDKARRYQKLRLIINQKLDELVSKKERLEKKIEGFDEDGDPQGLKKLGDELTTILVQIELLVSVQESER